MPTRLLGRVARFAEEQVCQRALSGASSARTAGDWTGKKCSRFIRSRVSAGMRVIREAAYFAASCGAPGAKAPAQIRSATSPRVASTRRRSPRSTPKLGRRTKCGCSCYAGACLYDSSIAMPKSKRAIASSNESAGSLPMAGRS